MGIQNEYNPDLALRNIIAYVMGERKAEECIPKLLERGKTYPFLKKGQRDFWIQGEVPLVETQGNQKLSLPIASIVILEPTHFVIGADVYTRGTYRVVEIFDPADPRPRFNGFQRVHYADEKNLESIIT